LTCARCNLTNVIENKYCSGCSYPLSPLAFEEIKAAENMKIQVLEKKHEQDMKAIHEEMNQQFAKIMSMIQQNPQLAYIKPEVLRQKTKKE
jgi:integrase/recombinase XerD